VKVSETRRASNLLGSSALFLSNILVCASLYLLRHSSANAFSRTVYLLIANAVAACLGFLPFRKENLPAIDGPTVAVIAWSACYCAEYGLFLAYPHAISLSQLIVCTCLAPVLSIYVSQDSRRATLTWRYKALSVAPVFLLLGIAYFERSANSRSWDAFSAVLLLLVFLSVLVSQSCARYVARNRPSTWSQPRLTLLNAVFLCVVLIAFARASASSLRDVGAIGISILVGILILAIQRIYIFSLRATDPFISAMTLCTIVPLSLATEVVFEHRSLGVAEAALAVGYVISTALSARLTA
jgi:hypothetical protein